MVVAASGGLCSTVLAYATVEVSRPVLMSVGDYRRISPGLECAGDVAFVLNCEHEILDTARSDPVMSVPTSRVRGCRSEQMPHRDSHLTDLLIASAMSWTTGLVAFGTSSTTAVPGSQLWRRSPDGCMVVAPFLGMTMADIIVRGAELAVPCERTWSCDRDGELHCGVCRPCQARQRAFVSSGLRDPTAYES